MDELPWKILNLVAKRGYIGMTREDFFREVRGVIYEELERAILLPSLGLVLACHGRATLSGRPCGDLNPSLKLRKLLAYPN